MSRRIELFLLVLNLLVLLFLLSLGRDGLPFLKPRLRRNGEFFNSSMSGTGAQLFAADGFIVNDEARTREHLIFQFLADRIAALVAL